MRPNGQNPNIKLFLAKKTELHRFLMDMCSFQNVSKKSPKNELDRYEKYNVSKLRPNFSTGS